MAIRNVGGQPVYVIDAPAVESAKTSTGTGYASLVSQLRWQIWEAAKQSVLQQMEFEKMGYQAQLDAYVKQKQELTRALGKTKDLKEKLSSGQITPAQYISLAKAEADAIRRQQDRELRYKEQSVFQRPAINPFTGKPTGEMISSVSVKALPEGAAVPGVPSPSALLGKSAAALGADTPDDRKAASVAAAQSEVNKLETEWNTGFKTNNPGNLKSTEWGLSPEGQDIEKRLGDAKVELTKLENTPASQFPSVQNAADEADIEAFASELQAQIDALEAPGIGFDTNVLSRTRETFGGMAGVGAFGFAPRREKISPIYDEARAREALDRAKAVESEAVSLSTAEKYNAKKATLLSAKERAKQNRIAELEVLAGTEDPANKEFQKLISTEIEKLKVTPASLNSEEDFALISSSEKEAKSELATGLLEAGPGPRTAASFMTRQQPEVIRPESYSIPDKNKPKVSDLELFKNFILPGVDAAGFQYGGLGPRSEDLAPQSVQPSPGPEVPVTQPEVPPAQPSVQPAVQPQPAAQIAVPEVRKDFREEATAKSEEEKRAKAANELYVQYAPRTINEQTGAETLYELNPLEKEKIFQLYLQESEEKMMTQQEGIAWYLDAIKKIRAEGSSGKVQPKTRQDRSAAYALKIVNKGKNLADKPAKLARLAKTDLPEAERMKKVPEHIALVDKLYEINKSKGDVYKSTYSEIARVYEKQPKLRDAALEYLVAKNLLYGNIA